MDPTSLRRRKLPVVRLHIVDNVKSLRTIYKPRTGSTTPLNTLSFGDDDDAAEVIDVQCYPEQHIPALLPPSPEVYLQGYPDQPNATLIATTFDGDDIANNVLHKRDCTNDQLLERYVNPHYIVLHNQLACSEPPLSPPAIQPCRIVLKRVSADLSSPLGFEYSNRQPVRRKKRKPNLSSFNGLDIRPLTPETDSNRGSPVPELATAFDFSCVETFADPPSATCPASLPADVSLAKENVINAPIRTSSRVKIKRWNRLFPNPAQFQTFSRLHARENRQTRSVFDQWTAKSKWLYEVFTKSCSGPQNLREKAIMQAKERQDFIALLARKEESGVPYADNIERQVVSYRTLDSINRVFCRERRFWSSL